MAVGTDTLIAGLLAQATGELRADPGATAALEAAAGIWSRALAAARVTPENERTRAITPAFLGCIGREWIRRGESVHAIEVDRAGRVRLSPCSTWNLTGSYDPSSWRYRLDMEGPSGNVTRQLPASGVIHSRFATDPRRPWAGLPPTSYASATAVLLANAETRLGQEAGGPVGHLIPVPADGGDGSDADPLAALKQTVGKLAGRVALVETVAAGWGEGMASAPRSDWKPQRFGPNPPASLVSLRSEAASAILAACGVPLALVSDADGTSQRESYRRFTMAALEPVADGLATELAEKLETPVGFDFRGLWAHDLAGRAAVYDKLVSSGMAAPDALRLSGMGA